MSVALVSVVVGAVSSLASALFAWMSTQTQANTISDFLKWLQDNNNWMKLFLLVLAVSIGISLVMGVIR